MMSNLLKDKIYEELELVIDPELGIDVVNLGLVYEVNINEGNDVHIVMSMTSMGCPMAGQIVSNVKSAILDNIEEIKKVEVDIVWSPPWTKERMSRYAQLALGIHR
ncbi:metal-sulfur cluster assembly factor [Cytobacillus eiseniae]